MAALAYTLAMLSAGMDEDDYEKTPDHAKERNLVIPLGGGEGNYNPSALWFTDSSLVLAGLWLTRKEGEYRQHCMETGFIIRW